METLRYGNGDLVIISFATVKIIKRLPNIFMKILTDCTVTNDADAKPERQIRI